MEHETLSPHQKALCINLDAALYGTFAEIGAGQEVARWFFLVGGASGTVAKTMSAYDMVVSDAVYGHSGRYVSRPRLEAMLTHEYDLLLERLGPASGARRKFFVFADTVATRSHRVGAGDGWLGVRFQVAPGAEASDVIIHAIMCDPDRIREQEALGILGVNLLYGAAFLHGNPAELIGSLMDHLTRDRIEIDMIKFSGPAFAGVDNRLMTLQLVEQGFTETAMFTAAGETVQPADVLYKRPILVERGRFRPVTLLTLDLLDRARAQFAAEPDLEGEQPVVVMEMTLRDLRSQAGIDPRDFLARADLLRAVGQTVLISRHGPYHELIEHLSRCTQKPIRIATHVTAFRTLMTEQQFGTQPSRALDAAGRLFGHNVRCYVYPSVDPVSGAVITADTMDVPPHLRHLYAHLLEHRHIEPIREFTAEYVPIDADEVLRRIQSGDPRWEQAVPPAIVEAIKRGRLFGWQAS